MVITMPDREDGPRFDPHGPDLVYVLIADEIAGQVQAGKLVPGQRLPREDDLAAEYGVARMTLRRAMRELRERGIVRTVAGKGTFVMPAKPSEP